jgi:hypothetical protein
MIFACQVLENNDAPNEGNDFENHPRTFGSDAAPRSDEF